MPSLEVICSSLGETCTQHQCLSSPPNEALVWTSALGAPLRLLQVKKDLVRSILGVLLSPASEIKLGSRTRAGLSVVPAQESLLLVRLQFLLFDFLSCCLPAFLCSPVLMVGPGHHFQLPNLQTTLQPPVLNAMLCPWIIHGKQRVGCVIMQSFFYNILGGVGKGQSLDKSQ